MMRIFTSIQSNFRKKVKGFSLLELLISISLLGLVMSLLYGAFFQISNSSLKVKATLETRQELRLLMKMVLDDLQNVQYLKHFAESGTNNTQQLETGLIVEHQLGPENTETGKLEEVSQIYFHSAVKSRFYPNEKERDPELHEVSYTLTENPDTKVWQFIRREDFYLDGNIREGGKSYVLSEAVLGLSCYYWKVKLRSQEEVTRKNGQMNGILMKRIVLEELPLENRFACLVQSS